VTTVEDGVTDLALLILRVVTGGLLAGHGAQKLFGSFGGSGVEGTAGWMESMNLRPGRDWALAAGLSEFGGGILTALGALNPLGPILAAGAMLMATLKVHHGKPIWGQAGGAELPVTNMAVLAPSSWPAPAGFQSTARWGSVSPAGQP
jgi:putative oxidoreductase